MSQLIKTCTLFLIFVQVEKKGVSFIKGAGIFLILSVYDRYYSDNCSSEKQFMMFPSKPKFENSLPDHITPVESPLLG